MDMKYLMRCANELDALHDYGGGLVPAEVIAML
jgi:hypothetical protein